MMKSIVLVLSALVALASAGGLGEGPEVYSSVTTKQVHSPFATSFSTRAQQFNDYTVITPVAEVAPVAQYAAVSAPVAQYATVAAAPVAQYAVSAPVAQYAAVSAPVAQYAAVAAPVAQYSAVSPVAYSSSYGYSKYY